MMKREYLIKDMMCNNCVMHLESIETELTGVTRVQANLSKQKLTVEFHPETINEAAIQAAIRSKGYAISE
jgi:copper chaperone CopZ